ncbi:MAG: cysteine hydrolase, partial [Nitrospinota bacterium]
DRSDLVGELNRQLKIDSRRTAVITVDMHRGHLDPEVATLGAEKADCERVISNSEKLLAFARSKGMPVVHVVATIRRIRDRESDSERSVCPFAMASGRAKAGLLPGRPSDRIHHNLEGSVGTQVIPSLLSEKDYVVRSKKRLSCFYGTDLEILLRALEVDTLVIIGINTNTCVLNTTFDTFNRDMKAIVISDCVASMYGDDLHVFGLENIKRCLGWVLTLDEFKKKVERGV